VSHDFELGKNVICEEPTVKFQICNGRTGQEVELRHRAKFFWNCSNRGRDMAIFSIYQNGGRPSLIFGITNF